MERLAGRLQHYDWGSSSALADLRGAEPSGLPEAELWFGAHRARSSEVVDGRAPEGVDLPDVAYLPYLVKLLAADRPLSLQAHPDAMAAADGYRREEEAGIGRGDATRSFPDPGPKPELLCAVTRFEALCGFRPVPEAREVAGALGVADHILTLLDDREPEAWRHVVGAVLTGDRAADRGRDVYRFVDAARRVLEGQEPATAVAPGIRSADVAGADLPAAEVQAAEVVCRLADRYPGDPALLLVPMMRRCVLQPGEAMYVGPGVLHAYLGGVALEVMTPCDNVVRGGFTSKHVDPDALVALLGPGDAPIVQRAVDGVHPYEVPVDDFAVWRIAGLAEVDVDVAGAGAGDGERRGPDVVVAVAGRTVVGGDLLLAPGEAALIPVADGAYRISVDGIAHRVSVGG